MLDGPYVLMMIKKRSAKSKPKLQNEWTEVEVKKVQVNFKAINTLHCTLNLIEFNRISTSKTTKEIWDKLKVTRERTSQVKKSKIALLSNQYEMFKIQPSESITS